MRYPHPGYLSNPIAVRRVGVVLHFAKDPAAGRQKPAKGYPQSGDGRYIGAQRPFQPAPPLCGPHTSAHLRRFELMTRINPPTSPQDRCVPQASTHLRRFDLSTLPPSAQHPPPCRLALLARAGVGGAGASGHGALGGRSAGVAAGGHNVGVALGGRCAERPPERAHRLQRRVSQGAGVETGHGRLMRQRGRCGSAATHPTHGRG